MARQDTETLEHLKERGDGLDARVNVESVVVFKLKVWNGTSGAGSTPFPRLLNISDVMAAQVEHFFIPRFLTQPPATLHLHYLPSSLYWIP